MRQSLDVHIRHRGTDLFQNKSQAIALKQLVKACFLPHYFYQELSAPSSPIAKKIQNGPSLAGSNLKNDKLEGRLSVKAFVSKKLRYNICEQLRKQMENLREQTEQISIKMRCTHISSVGKRVTARKGSTVSTAYQSEIENEPKRVIFKMRN